MTTLVAQRPNVNQRSAHDAGKREAAPEEQPVFNRESALEGRRYLSGVPALAARVLAISPRAVIALTPNVFYPDPASSAANGLAPHEKTPPQADDDPGAGPGGDAGTGGEPGGAAQG